MNSRDQVLQAELQPAPATEQWEKCRVAALGELGRNSPAPELVEIATWLGADKLLVGRASKRGEDVLVDATVIGASPPQKLGHRRQTLNQPAQADEFFSALLDIR